MSRKRNPIDCWTIYQKNVGQVRADVRKALAVGHLDPACFVIDLREPAVRRLLEADGSAAGVDRQITIATALGFIPAATLCLQRRRAKALVAPHAPEVADQLDGVAAAGGVPVIVMASGEVQLFALRMATVVEL